MGEPTRMGVDERTALSDLARQMGPRRAARALEISFDTLARAIAGFGVHRATITHLRSKLVELPRAAC